MTALDIALTPAQWEHWVGRANLDRANLDGTTAHHYTRWPVGFDPEAAGVTVR